MTALLLLVAALIGQDPVRVQATLADEEIQAGETTVLRVDVATDGERAQIDRFRSLPPGLEVQGTRDFDQRQFSLPGGTRRFISREYVLRALAPGRYRIPALEVVVGGDAYSTTSLLLTVTAAPARAGGEIGGAESEGVVLRAWLDADTVFVGEQVTMEAEAMFSQDARLRLRRAPEYEPPSPSGFWVHDLPASRRPVTRMVEDNVYEVQRFRRAFFPLSPGDFEIPSARLEYEMRQGLLHAPETRELRSDPLPLVVVPVPGPPPPGFTGAVGRYMARGWLEPAEVPTGEAAVLTVEVEGEGNVKALPPPVLPELPDIDVFPPSEEADVATRPTGLGGTKRFSWVLIPRRAGEHEIPAIRYAYFDPDRGGFETVAVGPMALEVTGATGATSADRPVEPSIRYLATSPEPGDPLAWVRSRWFAAAQLVPLLFLLGALGWTARARRGQPSLRELRRRRRTGLQELEGRAATADPELFADAESFARRWLGDRLAIGPRDRWSSAVGQAAGLTAKTTAAVGSVLERLAAVRYAPTRPGPEERREILRALGRALERVDREASPPRRPPRRRSRTRAAAGGLVLLACTASALGASPQALRPAELFDSGLAAYDAEDYSTAAQRFDRYVGLRPDDPAGWYNLGTAYYRAGHTGYAVWAWLRVPKIDPRHRDARHNLRVAGVAPEVVARVAPPLPLRSSELFLLASVAWLATIVAATLWLVRGRSRAAGPAMVALAAALGLAGAGWASSRQSDTLIVLEASTLRAAPMLRGQPVAELEPGAALVPVTERDEWVRARSLHGEEGWVERAITGTI